MHCYLKKSTESVLRSNHTGTDPEATVDGERSAETSSFDDEL